MKKLIGILGILLFTASVFGQPSVCYFLSNTNDDHTYTHRFQYNGEQYAIGYDSRIERTYLLGDNDILERTLSLYRQDGNTWTRVSNPIRRDYWKSENDVQSYEWYKDNMGYYKGHGGDLNGLLPNVGYSSVEIKNGIAVIHMLVFYGIIGVDNDYNYRWDTYKLIPQKDNTYLATKFTQ